MDQVRIKLQLGNLQTLLEFIDPNFAEYLKQNDSINMYFCFRWILILFKREFTFPDIMKLWEVIRVR
jgi:TBC1 domain family member 15